jgi:DNA-binding response OmpR family regulator/HPt (histidine-containing phosphotransfer) domain-containing protein
MNDAMQARLDAIWEQSRPAIGARVDAIENAAMALLEGSLDDTTRKHARDEAHKLAGVAGTFGFSTSTDHAREAEEMLAEANVISSADIMRLSTIAVALRRELIDVGRTAGGAAPQPTAAVEEIRVGMIDDDPGMLALVGALLADGGVRVEGMSEPEKLWKMLETAPPDALILDVDMPEISGIELCRSIRANSRWDAVPIIFLTARTGASVELFGAGADNYLTKPVDGPELLAVIRRVARRHRAAASATTSASALHSDETSGVAATHDADVVIVDDDAVLTELLSHSLVARGYRVHVLSDGSAALALLTGTTPRLRARVIILDVGLPEHDGLAVLRALARDGITRQTRVIMLTARSLESEVVQALDLGAHDHVGKPFSVAVLMHRVVKALDGALAVE